jgi:hypothetical protein
MMEPHCLSGVAISSSSFASIASIIALISGAIDDLSDENGWANLGAVGSTITNLRPNFDPRLHGHKKLSDLVRSLSQQFAVEERGDEGSSAKSIYVRNVAGR